MKYSQAALVACIGSVTLVSAFPVPGTGLSGNSLNQNAARDIVRDLDARNPLDWAAGLKATWKNRAGRHAQHKADDAAKIAADLNGGTSAGMSALPVQRRDLSVEDDSVVARDYDEELGLRNLDRRMLFFSELSHEHDKARAARLQNKAAVAAAKVRGSSAMDPTGGFAMRMFEDVQYDQRDLMDVEGDFAERDYVDEGDITARDYEEELEMRDFDEDGLVARDTTFFDTLSAVARTFSPPATVTAPAPAPAPAQQARDVLEEFDARDYDEFDELD